MPDDLAPLQQSDVGLSRRHDLLPSTHEFQTMLQMAELFVKSGLLPKAVQTPAAALLIMQKGRELGIPPTYALSNIHVVEGKPTAGAELMLALIYRDHGDDAVKVIDTTDQRCVVAYKRRGWSECLQHFFTIEEAKQAGLGGKDNWRHYPAAMLRARCISAMARMTFPDSIGGMYTPEEMGAEVSVDEHGSIEVVSLPESQVLKQEPAMHWPPPENVHGSATNRGEALMTMNAAMKELAFKRSTDQAAVMRAGCEALHIVAKNTGELSLVFLHDLTAWARAQLEEQPPDVDEANVREF